MPHSIYHILNNDCPQCRKGKIFDERNIFFNLHFPKMHTHCSNCNYKFKKAPGYFFGAMYVNYGISVAQGILTYLIAHLFFTERFDLRMIPIIAVVLISLSPFNIRLSRILWIYLFKNYAT